MRKSKKIKKTKHHCGLWQPMTVSRPEALSLGEVNSRGVCIPGHQLLPNILNMSGLHLLPSFLGLKGTGAQSSCPKALGPGAAL